MNKKINNGLLILIIALALISVMYLSRNKNGTSSIFSSATELTILSSYENQNVASSAISYAKSQNINLTFKYMGDLDMIGELNNNSKNYDGIWISNSMWLYMLDNTSLTSESQSVSISPVAFGIKKSKASELGLIGKSITNQDIVNLIKQKKIKYVMPSVTQTNTGATAYFGFLNALAGNPEVLTESMLQSTQLTTDLTAIFSGVERVSGDEDYLQTMFLNSDNYEAVIADESSLIHMNQQLVNDNREPLYLLYPTDGVAVNDSVLAFINNDKTKKDAFLTIQNYLLSGDGQSLLEESGRRTWYGGTSSNADKSIFNPDWGIDTSKYLNVTKFPSKSVMTAALNLYIEELRKPTHIVFCLDFSGSMYGKGDSELKNAMDYILTYSKASTDHLQFSKKDKISIIAFSSKVNNVWYTDSGYETSELLTDINNEEPNGSTALYDAVIKGLDILNAESTDYTKTIVAMTDGRANVGTFDELKKYYLTSNSEIPIYSITFGDADETQLEEIANLSNSKIFDGKTDLLSAFKQVRGYN